MTLNYTTKVPVGRTVGEIHELLSGAGAAAVMTRYTSGQPVGVTFSLVGPHGARNFTLPVDVEAMNKVLRRKSISGGMSRAVFESPEHAARVAWRVALAWLAAQLTLVEVGMAKLDQVMLPYLRVTADASLYEAYCEREQAAIESTGRQS